MNPYSTEPNITEPGFTPGAPQQDLPNATAVLVLGILSIVGCMCYGIVGLICGIIALVLAKKDRALYAINPIGYTDASYKNLNAGRVCAIIGTSLSALYVLIVGVYFVFLGTLILSDPAGGFFK
jgi:hypothetical protein